MTDDMRSEACALKDIFAAGLQYCVPPFQRSFEWEVVEALDLVADLREAMEEDSSHFIGTLVFNREADTGPFEIVDGQQRLTTLTIMLCVLRDLMGRNEAGRDRVRQALADEDRKRGTQWRLSLNEFDNPFFRASVQESQASLLGLRDPDRGESRDRLADVTAAIVKVLRNIKAEERRELSRFVLDRCVMVRVDVADRVAGHKVFRVLNNRGKAPSDHDIVKTDLLEKAGLSAKEMADHARRWSDYERRIGGKGLDDLLQQIRTLYAKGGKGGRVLDFRRRIMSRIEPREILENMLPKYVSATEQISACALDKVPDPEGRIAASLVHLATIDHHGWRAPALKFLVDRDGEAEAARRFFPLLERLAFVIQLVVPEREQRTKRYRRVIDAVQDDAKLFDPEGPLHVSVEEGEKVAERLLGRFTSFSQRRATLLRANAAMPGGEVISSKTDASVEHVLPKTVEEGTYWDTRWPNSATRALKCDTLGNLVLLSAATNQKADRHDFETKKRIYFSDGDGARYAVTRDIQPFDVWQPTDVDERTRRLVNHLLRAWGLAAV